MRIDARLAAARLPPLPRDAWLEIDEAALAANLRVIARLAGGAGINAVVKADAYGHGIESAARVFADAGAARLCVASLDEALYLRQIGIAIPILVLFQAPPARVGDAVRAAIELTAADEHATLATLAAHDPADGELVLQLEVESGLSRGGLPPERVVGLARRIVDSEGVRWTGIWTHLASPESESATATQVAAFERATSLIRDAGLPLPARHVAASGGLLSGRAPIHEQVRPGLCLYGILPEEVPLAGHARAAATELRPALALKCRAVRIERIAAGTPVGYGGRWVAPRESVVATLPVGYGDGWARAYAPVATALVRGRRVPLVGSVAMDAVMADVTDIEDLAPADEFVLIGEQGDDRITPLELAALRGTISWEVVTTMSQRLPRVYHAAPDVHGLRTLAGEVRLTEPAS